MNYTFLAIIFLTIVFDYFYFKKCRRSMLSGVMLILSIIIILTSIIYIGFSNELYSVYLPALIFLGIFIISFPFLILSYLITLFYSFIELIKKEGRSFSHSLSLVVAFMLLANIIIIPQLNTVLKNKFFLILSNLITAYISYFFFMLFIFFVSSLINIYYPRKKEYKYIIVLGSGLIKDKITPLLKSRIELGISEYKRIINNGYSTKIIVSGGKGFDEQIPEAEAMAKYIIGQHIPENDIIIENKSKNTYENLLFSSKLMSSSKDSNLIVTNKFHLFRALILSRKLHLNSDGAGSKTKLYFSINALIREFIGVMYLNKYFHLIFVFLITIMVIIQNIL
ncbi:YdcF family protein [Mycoplasma sp. P36-A1]|uniref:YdcF family protein n=1 Tax=Mycoplasma sp. P36-A1 TaxID=3252900 RepID=UPI003C30B539